MDGVWTEAEATVKKVRSLVSKYNSYHMKDDHEVFQFLFISLEQILELYSIFFVGFMMLFLLL